MSDILTLHPGTWQVDFDFDPQHVAWRKAFGWRPICIDSYVAGNDLRWVVVWKKLPARETVGASSWDAAFSISKLDVWAKQTAKLSLPKKQFPTMVAAVSYLTEVVFPPRFAVVWEDESATLPSTLLQMDLQEGTFDDLNSSYLKLQYRLRWVTVHEDARFTAIWQKHARPYEVYWHVTTHQDTATLAAHVEAHARNGVRPHLITARDDLPGTSGPRHVAIWHSDSIGPQGPIYYPLHASEASGMKKLLQDAALNGFYPYRLTGGFVSGQQDPYFVAIVAKTDRPVQRTERIRRLFFLDPGPVTTAGGTDFGTGRPSPEQPRPEPEGPPPVEARPSAPTGPPPVEAFPAAKAALADLEKYVLDHMKQRNIRAGSLAVARGKNLVYAGAFTWAEPDYPTTQPYHKFRFWSVAKPFTSIGLFRLIDNATLIKQPAVAPLLYTDKLRDLVEIDGPWKNEHWDSIRLVDLMAMKIKWRNADPDAKRECDVSEESMPIPQQGLPRLKRDIITALADVEDVIDEQLYHRYWYTNYNYTALGHVIEELTTKGYSQWMKDNVWAAVGISEQDLNEKRVDISLLDPLGALLPHEVRPEEGVPVVGTPAWQLNRLEPGPHGWNPYRYDAHGGWSGAPYDVVRLLAALGDDGYCSANLMSVANRDTMWKPIGRLEASSLGIPTGSALGGWGGMTPRFNGQAGGGSAKAWHRRSDKLTFAYAFNIDPRETKWQGKKMTAWLSDTELVKKIEAVIATGGFAGPDLWSLAGYTQPL